MTNCTDRNVSRACDVEHQVQRLWRRDQEIGRRAQHRLARPALGVAGAERDGGFVERHAEPFRRQGDAAQGRPQVLLDVDRERAQRRDVEHPAAADLLGHRLVPDPVDGPEERRERLSRPGGGEDQGVVAGRDRRPPTRLCPGRRRERSVEPRLDRRRKLFTAHARNGTPAVRQSFWRPNAVLMGKPDRLGRVAPSEPG